MGRRPCCSKEELGLMRNRGAWTSIEDKILTDYIKLNGEGKWRSLPNRAGLKRCGKSCRLRWMNYLRPDIKRGNITTDEEDLIVRLHNLLGNRWSLIAGRLPGRTDNEIKNYWNTRSKKVQTNENPKFTEISPNIESAPVRTKASRCTQVIVDPNPLPGLSTCHEPIGYEPSEPFQVMTSPYFSIGENSSNFMMDMEMDPKFLYELFDIDLPSLDKNAIKGSSNSCDSDQFHLFTSALVFDPDLDSVVPPTDPIIDWLQDH